MSQKVSVDFLQSVHVVCGNTGIMRRLAQDDFMRNIRVDITFSKPQNTDVDSDFAFSNKIFFLVIKKKGESKKRSSLQKIFFRNLAKKARKLGIRPSTIKITYGNSFELFESMRHHLLHGILNSPCKAA
jgi:hypothetical protein